MGAREMLIGDKVVWGTISIPKSSANGNDLQTLVKSGLSAAEDELIKRCIAWKIFKEKDNTLSAYWVGDVAAGTVARSFGANEEVSSADFPVGWVGMKNLVLCAAADTAITAGFYAICAPTTP